MIPKTILVTNRANIRYLCGFSGTSGYALLHGKRGALFTDSRYHLVAKNVLPQHFSLIDITSGFEKPLQDFLKKHRVRTLGFEGGEVSLRFWKRLKKIARKQKLADVGDAIARRRIVKKPAEMACIRRAQKITDEIFSILRGSLKPGVSEIEIAWKIECLAHELGAEGLSFPPIIGINEHSASPHHRNTDRKLKRGDLILIDMGVIFRGFCSDMTRVLFTKQPTAEETKIYGLVLEGQGKAIRGIRAGMTGRAGDALARSVIEKAGFSKQFGHSLGHGVGLEVHELPNLSQKYKEKIPAGTVVTVEPGIYLPGKFGVRLEDMVHVRKNGAENLTKSPKALHESVIKI